MKHRLPSSADHRLPRLKRELTLQLYLREGPIWEAINELRGRWAVNAPTRVPGNDDRWLPPNLTPANARVVRRWRQDLDRLHDVVIPLSYRRRAGRRLSRLLWFSFLANCVLYDPPAIQLLDFADTGNAMTVGFSNVDPQAINQETWKGPVPENLLVMVDPPVVMQPDPEEVRDVERWFWQELIAELGRRHLQELGIDVFASVDTILRETGLRNELLERYVGLPLHPLIVVDPDMTKDDILGAFRVIAATQPERSTGGRPPLDRLTAVQCAVLKRQGWTNREIAEHFDWPLRVESYDRKRRSNSVIAHLRLGKEILDGRANPPP